MDAMAKLDRFNLDPTVRSQLAALMSSLIQQNTAELAAKNAELAEKDTKIAALTHELAYYKRIRFGQKTEALAGLQRDLFFEDVDTDVAEIGAELAAAKAIYAPEDTPRPTVAVPFPYRTAAVTGSPAAD